MDSRATNETLAYQQELCRSLIASGLPARYSRRVYGEFAHHWECMQHNPSGLNDFGDVDELAKGLAMTYRQARWYRRFPWLTYLVLPPVALILFWFVYFLGFVLAIGIVFPDQSTGSEFTTTSPVFLLAIVGLYAGSKVIPFAALAMLLGRLGSRSGRSLHWMICSMALLSLTGGLLLSSKLVTSSILRPEQLIVRFGTLDGIPFIVADQCLQAAIPLFVGGLILCNELHARRDFVMTYLKAAGSQTSQES